MPPRGRGRYVGPETHLHQPQQMAAGGWAAAHAAYAGAAIMPDPCESAVMQILHADNSMDGVHTQAIYNQLMGTYTQHQVDQALQGLMQEAHVYTTMDEHHWKAT